MTIGEHVTKILVERLGVDPDEVTPGALLVEDLGADTLDVLEIAFELEDAFEIAIPNEHVEPWITVRDVIAYLNTRGVKGLTTGGAV